MRWLLFYFFALVGTAIAGEPSTSPAYPLWDGVETVADYAEKVKLPSTKTLDLGNNVKLELVLIPAGKFIMGTPEPVPLDEAGFHKKIITGQVLLTVSGGALAMLLAFVVISAIRKRQMPKYSLLFLLVMTLLAGGCVLSGLHWQKSVQSLDKARAEYASAKSLFDHVDKEEKPAHSVTLTKPFYMGKFPVTQEQYHEVTGTNPSSFNGINYPVDSVSWDEAQGFCKRVTEQTKQQVRLPTEAEWEYSCRAGTTTAYYSGYSDADLGRVAWYWDNSNQPTHSVGQKEPNAFGLYDIHGNVWQWCADLYGEDYYRKSEAENPQGPVQGTYRVMRGASWANSVIQCRSAQRGLGGPIGRAVIGFRVVVEPSFKSP